MPTDEFSPPQILVFCVCLLQFPLHIIVMIFDIPHEIILFDTEVVVNMTAHDNLDKNYIERVQNFRLDVPLYPFVIILSLMICFYAVFSANIFQSGSIDYSLSSDSQHDDALVWWGVAFWFIFGLEHFFLMGCVLNPVEVHFFVVVAFFVPLSVYRLASSRVVSSESEDAVLMGGFFASLDFLTFVLLVLTTLSTVRSVCRMVVLFLVIFVDVMTIVGHCYDGGSVRRITIFNCRFFCVFIFSCLSLAIVAWWRVIMFDIGLTVKSF
jgi:hypothetical protein